MDVTHGLRVGRAIGEVVSALLGEERYAQRGEIGQDLEWTLLHALSQLGRPGGTSAYFRLSTRPIDQSLAALPADPTARAERRRQVLAGGYRLVEGPHAPQVAVVTMGVLVPEALAAAEELARAGVPADVVLLTSPDLVFRALRVRQGLEEGSDAILDILFPAERRAPLVTVLDGHAHTLAFLSTITHTPLAALGVHDFGQVGDVQDLYCHFGIDTDTIVGAAVDLIA